MKNRVNKAAYWSGVLILAALPFGDVQADDSATKVIASNNENNPAVTARIMLDRWLSIKQQTGAIENQWEQQQQQLLMRQQLLEQEKQQLQRVLESSNTNADEVDQERQRLLTQQAELEQEQQALADTLTRIWPQLLSTLHRLPPPLAQAWQQHLSVNDEQSSQSEQLDTVLKLLRALQDFQQRLSTNESLITLTSSETLLAKQLYLGAARAWFITADGKYTGTGDTDGQGWRWHLNPEVSADSVKSAIAMLEQNKNIGFVSLPMTLATNGDHP